MKEKSLNLNCNHNHSDSCCSLLPFSWFIRLVEQTLSYDAFKGKSFCRWKGTVSISFVGALSITKSKIHFNLQLDSKLLKKSHINFFFLSKIKKREISLRTYCVTDTKKTSKYDLCFSRGILLLQVGDIPPSLGSSLH